MLVARFEDAVDIPVEPVLVVFHRPFVGILLRNAVCIEQIAHAHEVLVTAAFFEDDVFIGESLLSRYHCLFQQLHRLGMLLLVLLIRFEVDEEGFGLWMVIRVRVVRKAAQLGTSLAFRVGLDTKQVTVVVVCMLERILIQFLLLLEVQQTAVLAIVEKENTKPATADGPVREQRVRVFLGGFFQTVDNDFVRIVDVHHPDARPSGNVLLRLAAFEQGRHREADASRLFITSFLFEALVQVIPMPLGPLLHRGIIQNQLKDLLQGSVFRVTIGVTIE